MQRSIKTLLVGVCCLVLALPLSAQNLDVGKFIEAQASNMTNRLMTLDFETERDPSELLQTARHSLGVLAGRLNSWGTERIIDLASPLGEIGDAGQDPFLTAISRYDACSVYLEMDFDNPDTEIVNLDDRITAAMGTVYLEVTSWYLRDHFLAGGGRLNAVEPLFDPAFLERSRSRIASDPELLRESRILCGPVLEALLGANETSHTHNG